MVQSLPPNPPMDVGPWAQEKLDCLGKYLSAYTKILSKRGFAGFFYVDAFAGPGSLKVRRQQEHDSPQDLLFDIAAYAVDDEGEASYLAGSPRVALEIERPFTDYVFLELDPVRTAQLEQLKREFSSAQTRIHIRNEDCNSYLLDLINRMQHRWREWRGVVFLDPFGMQVPWDTIARLGATGAIEVLINFPVGMAVQRLLKRSGEFNARERKKLDAYFGTEEWYDLLYKSETDLVGGHTAKIKQSSDVLVRWYRVRLKQVFGYVTEAREIQDTVGRPLYYLIFAGPNRTGARIANNVLNQGARRVR